METTLEKKPAQTGKQFQFRTPAGIMDFAQSPLKQQAMDALWSQNLDGFTQQGMQSNQWNTSNTPPTTNYYNPVQRNPASQAVQITWSAFPGRLAYNFPNAGQDELNKMADTGQMPGPISNDPCNSGAGSSVPYYPYGPRGWQDEYCEWAVTRNQAGKITRIDFTCENPEYWNSLWQIDPQRVLELYREILGKPQITIDDLSLPGTPDPVTGRPAYNPLNKWNTGPVSGDNQGGAVHLTSTPNTLQTEIGLATAATVQRNNPSGTTGNTFWPSAEYNPLLCDAQYGQKNRNSDPNIGGNVNNLVTKGFNVTLADPPGLYIQMPDFSSYKTPDGADASGFWTIIRGSKSLDNAQTGAPLPGNFILHAVFEVPKSKGYTVGDISIGGVPIQWGSQVAATFKMQIVGSGYAGTVPSGYDKVGTPPTVLAQPQQLFHQSVFNAMYPVQVPNPVNHPISLLSNSTFIPPKLNVGYSGAQMVLTVSTCTAKEGQPATYPAIGFSDPGITAQVTAVKENVNYAVPGNSMPGTTTALFLTLNVDPTTQPGVKDLYVTNAGQQQGPPMHALLEITPITVAADIKWQNTGIQVSSGSVTKISYDSGLWTANPANNGGQLYNAAGDPKHIPAKTGYTMPGENEGALIGKVGSTEFFVGMGTTVPAGLTGELMFCINDDLNGIYGAGFTDNLGAVTVKVTQQ